MTDPERFSRRSKGLAAELLRAGASERPNEHGIRRQRGVAANSGQRSRSAGLVDRRSALRAGDGG